MEIFAQILIVIHAITGGIALATGLLIILLKKGNAVHQKLGKVFSISLLISSFLSLIIAVLPNHQNVFLFLIGFLTMYSVLSGWNAISFKNKNKTVGIKEKLLTGSMISAAFIMYALGVMNISRSKELGILFFFFGTIGLVMSLLEIKMYLQYKTNSLAWLRQHIGAMMGAFIASVTAFMIAGLHFQTLWAWITPTIIGTLYIIYWQFKIKYKEGKTPRVLKNN